MVNYFEGDLLNSGCTVVCHQTNCKGVMGSGVAKQIREKYPFAYEDFFTRHNLGLSYLGEIDFSWNPNTTLQGPEFIVNMYAEEDYLPRGICHTDYEAFRICCKKIKLEIKNRFKDASLVKIGFPDHIGCGLAGGDWNIVKQIIEEEFADPEWNVEIWKFNPKEN